MTQGKKTKRLGSSSSQQMENFEVQEHAIKLGKAIVEALGLQRSNDTLSRWMAHYISEQIAEAERTSGTERDGRQQNCWKTIRKLEKHWEEWSYHRSSDSPDSVLPALIWLHENESSVSLPSWLLNQLRQHAK
jgi:hypothetical protein